MLYKVILYLSENGKLIFACENALGLNFLSGAVHDEDETAFTKGELEEAFERSRTFQSGILLSYAGI